MTAKPQTRATSDPPGDDAPVAPPPTGTDRAPSPTSPGLGPDGSPRVGDDDKTTPLPVQAPPPAASGVTPPVERAAVSAEPPPATATAGPATGAAPAGAVAESAAAGPEKPTSEAEEPSAPPDIEIRVFGRTDVGLVREHNEDNFLIADLTSGNRSLLPEVRAHFIGRRGSLFVVCDGMGGAAAGEVASLLAVDTIFERLLVGEAPRTGPELARTMVDAVEEAGRRIFSAARLDRTRRGMGTTVTAASVVDSTLYLAQVGDSRAYVVRHAQIEQVTRDQSLVNQLIEAGQLTEEEAEAFEHSNIILQALGTAADVSVDVTHVPLRRGDILVVCSDGLSGCVPSELIKEAVLSNEEPLEACKKLTDLANAAGGHDNITVIVARFGGEGLAPPSADDRLAFERISLPPSRPGSGPPSFSAAEASFDGPPTYRPTAPDLEASPTPDDDDERPQGRGGLTFLLLLLALVLGAAIAYVFFSGLLMGGQAPAAALAPRPVPQAPAVASAPRFVSRTVAPVQFRTSLPGGRLRVDGVDRGAFDRGVLKLELPVGVHDVSIVVDGTTIVSRQLTVLAGLDAEVTLDPPPPPVAAPRPLAPVTPVPSAVPAEPSVAEPPVADPAPVSKRLPSAPRPPTKAPLLAAPRPPPDEQR